MDFALSVEQQDLADAERAWLQRNDPILERRESIDDGPARSCATVRKHVVDAGLTSLLTSDMGATHVDLLVLAEAHGWAGSPFPLAEAAVGARLAEIAGHPSWEAAAAGHEIALPVLAAHSFDVELCGDTLHLRGTSAAAAGLIDADRIVVAATHEGRDLIVVIPAADVAVRPVDTLDLLRSWAVVDFDTDVAAGDWTHAPAGTAALLADQLATFHTVDALGAADRLLGSTVEYAGQRTQFGSVIGGFQAVKHHLANMALAVEAARSVLWAAAASLDDHATDDENARTARARAVTAAVAYGRGAASEVAQLALQVHGGIGFTWEHDLHLLLRRIKIDELSDGGVAGFRDRLVDVFAVPAS